MTDPIVQSATIKILCTLANPASGSARWQRDKAFTSGRLPTPLSYPCPCCSRPFSRRLQLCGTVSSRDAGGASQPVASVIEKCLGGAAVSTFLGIVILALAGLAHVPHDPILILPVIGELLLLSFTLTAFGVMTAARITQRQAFMGLTQMLVMPLSSASVSLHPAFAARVADRAHPV